MIEPPRKTAWQFFTKLRISLMYNLTITLLGIYPTELKLFFSQKLAYGYL